jgi:undecaprenyl-diphosphatase
MNIFWAIILGIVQGFTEFLPVSSSGHLAIFQALIPSFVAPGVLFEAVLHLGTSFAVIYFFKNKLIDYLRKHWRFLVIATLPVILVGSFFQTDIESLFGNIKFVGSALLVTALFNFLTDKKVSGKLGFTNKNVLLMGIAQAIAVLPGISRSGATIFAGTSQKIKKDKVAEFSFLLSIPAIFGANILQFFSHGANSLTDPLYYLAGFTAAFISGYVAIGIVLKALHKSRFKLFGIYCLIVGLLVLLI